MNRIILASKSPRRIEFLKRWGFDVEIVDSKFKEKILDAPIETAVYNATGKAFTVAKKFKNRIVVGADTIVTLNNEIIGKPKNSNDAIKIIKQLSGKTHFVITGIAAVKNNNFVADTCRTAVTFRNISEEEIRVYVNTGEGKDKAGGYAVQGIGSNFIIRIDGPLDNVIGMPLSILKEILKKIER